jgi:hypothetical protein
MVIVYQQTEDGAALSDGQSIPQTRQGPCAAMHRKKAESSEH